MLKLTSFLPLLVTVSCFANGQSFSLGSDYDPERYMQTQIPPPLARGDYTNLPQRVVLDKYLPQIKNQGSSGSCVGWSTTYAAFTASYNYWLEASELTKRSSKGFSPAFTFNQIKISRDCEGGSYISDALKVLQKQGALSIAEFPYSDKSCYILPTSSQINKAQAYRISEFVRLSSTLSRRSMVVATRKMLAKKSPVVIGMPVGPDFMDYNGMGRTIGFSENLQSVLEQGGLSAIYALEGFGGHAMTVVGYDDNRDGGAFKVMNSWGTDWGDKGFFWIKYKDYQSFIAQAYGVVGQPVSKPPPPKPIANFTANTVLKGLNDKPLTLVSTANGYQLKQPLPSGSLLRAEVNVSSGSFVYIVGTDTANANHVVLFPKDNNISNFVPENNTLLLPGPSEDYYIKLDNQPGTDQLIIFHSKVKLDIKGIASKLDEYKAKPIAKRLALVINSAAQRKYSEGSYQAYMQKQHVLTNVIEITHNAESVISTDRTAPKIAILSPAITGADAFIDGNSKQRYVTEDIVTIRGIAQDNIDISDVEIDNAYDVKFSSRGAFIAKVDLSDVAFGQAKVINIRAVDANQNSSETAVKLVKSKK